MLDPLVLVALAGAGLLAGFVDAIAGGGGLIALPALLAAGIPPVAALGTNKVQSVIGTAIAAITYWRKGFVSLRSVAIAIACALVAAFAGALVVKQFDTSTLRVAVPVALVPIAPNPARGLAQLRFSLSRRGPATVEIMDIQGRRVRELVGGELEAGDHPIVWRGDNARGSRVGAGVYFVRMRAEGRVLVRRFVWIP